MRIFQHNQASDQQAKTSNKPTQTSRSGMIDPSKCTYRSVSAPMELFKAGRELMIRQREDAAAAANKNK